MDIFQWERNPWGQEILVRISWDLLWASIVVGFLFVVGHLLFRRLWVPRILAAERAQQRTERAPDGVPERLSRHSLASRLFHWVMAAAMFVLLITAFFPVMGLQFPWVTIHWLAGLALTGAVGFHIVHAMVCGDLRAVAVEAADVRDLWQRFLRASGRPAAAPAKHPKYPVANKLYHHVITLVSGVAIATGLLMMVRVRTPFWTRNPYLLAEQTWGWVYVLHGLSAVALVSLVVAHVYFAILPEKRWLTRSMVRGWIHRAEYLQHHDPRRWAPRGEPTSGDGHGQ